MEAMWMRFIPVIQKAIQWVVDGLIGEVQMVQADLVFEFFKPKVVYSIPSWRVGPCWMSGFTPLPLLLSFLEMRRKS